MYRNQRTHSSDANLQTLFKSFQSSFHALSYFLLPLKWFLHENSLYPGLCFSMGSLCSDKENYEYSDYRQENKVTTYG